MILAIDFGATNIRAGIVVGKRISDKKEIKTPKGRSEILKALLELIESFNVRRKDQLCIAIAGFEKKGKIQGADNMDFNGVNLRGILNRRFHCPVFIDNDANCAGLAESIFGLGRGHKDFVLLTLGTGIGGAVFVGGKLYRGQGAAGEVGRLIMHDIEFEDLASGDASVTLARKMGLGNITSIELEKKANKFDKKAKKVYDKIGESLGLGLLNISYILDPEIIILGGGFSKVKHIYPMTKKTIDSRDKFKRKLHVVHAKLGDEAGLIGASLLSKEK